MAYQFGRAIRRAIIFDSMVSAPMDDEITIQPLPEEVEAVKEMINSTHHYLNATYVEMIGKGEKQQESTSPRVMQTYTENYGIWMNMFAAIPYEEFDVPKYHEP